MNPTKLLALVVGFWVVMRSINKDATGKTLIDRVLNQSGGANQALPAGATVNPASFSQLQTVPASVGTNPFPGAVGNRLDQGFDLTSKSFLAPAKSQIVVSRQSDSGWAGGGYLAAKVLSGPQAGKYYYLAEGIAPTVNVGDVVQQGQSLGLPVSNPYNGVQGNIETGPANPASPSQPLAQVSSNPRAAVISFYDWLRSLGAPATTSAASAGHA